MALSGRLRVIVTTLVPLLNRSERLAAFQVYSPRPGKPPSCNTYSCDRVPGRTNTGGATATGDRCCRIFRSSQRRPLQPLQRSLRPTSTASSAGGQLSGDTSRERGGGSIRRTAVSDASGEVVAAADQPQEKLALTMEDARKALKSLFGHDDFRDGQVSEIREMPLMLKGRSACVLTMRFVRQTGRSSMDLSILILPPYTCELDSSPENRQYLFGWFDGFRESRAQLRTT